MSGIEMRTKKGKNFKEVIEDEKKKGRTFKRIMRLLTSVDQSVVYAGSFLLFFVTLAVAVYYLFSPGVFVWAGILVVMAVLSSLLASRITKVLKRNQWKFKSID